MKEKLTIIVMAAAAIAARAAESEVQPCCMTAAPGARASCCAEMAAKEDPASCCMEKALAAEPASCCAQKTAATEGGACCAGEAKSLVAAPACCAEEPAGEPFTALSLYQLEAAWTDDSGKPVTLASFRGRPVVIAMFFASCEYACPVLTADMQRMRGLLPETVREATQFVLVSFDVARDTPEALRQYRERTKLDSDAWTLLRGDEGAVQELAMLLGVKYKRDARGQFSHSNLFTVLNQEGEIVHQHAGLMGDVSEAARFVAQTLR